MLPRYRSGLISGPKATQAAAPLHRLQLPLALACLLAWWGAVGPAVEARAQNLAEDRSEGSARLAPSGSAAGQGSGARAIFVPVILTSSGQNDSFFTSELTLTNRGNQPATLNYTYTAHRGGGSGAASERLAAGRQKIVPDAIEHLRTLGLPIPKSGNRIGTLRVAVSGSSRVGVTARTTTPVPGGRAGLAYPGVATGFEEAVFLCGLRQNRQDRSNVAFQNLGTEGEITLRTTVYSGEAGTSSRVLEDVTLAPGGFHQYSGLLATAGFTQGYVKVERVKGTAPFYAYGVINDQANSDGSFVFPVTAGSLMGIRGQTLPVIVETGVFSSELMVTNFSKEAKTVTFRFRAEAIQTPDKTATAEWTLQPGQQVIVPDIVERMRRMGGSGIGPPGSTFGGALIATVAQGDMSGIAIGARTGSPGGGGRYGVFYNAAPYGAAFRQRARVDALQQNRENRSNLALVNTGEADGSPSVFQLDIFDGATGMRANTVTGIRVPARGWRQINGILARHAAGVTQGYVLVRKTSGSNPFLAYGVVNDGGAPGQRSGDGAYLPAMEGTIDPGTGGMTDRQVLEALYHATGGANWKDRSNWLSNEPLSKWHGVETDESGRVTSLDLSQNQLRGPIPPELAGLASLQSLSLSGNRLNGAIPAALAGLANLRELNLGGNQLSGIIPAALAGLSNLERLELWANQLSGAIPPELAGLTNLQTLSLWGNHLNGTIPAALAGLANLHELNLAGNQLSGAIPPELAGLTNLLWLDLSFNPDLTGTIPAGLQQLSLATLYLMATAVCVPETSAFRNWSATFAFLPSGAPCGRSLPEVPTIDVAVFFTPAARKLAGGAAEMGAAIDLMVAQTNQAYQDSGVNQRIRLAVRQEVPYEEENQSGSLVVERLSAKSDGHMDEVHAIRNRVGADLVHLIAEVTDVGGIADLPGTFGLTCAGCDAVTFAHELGHNMGLSHDRYVAGDGLLPYSYGYVNQKAFVEGAPESARWFTIMAYPDQCFDADLDCPAILRFSNPNQTWMGDPLGVPGEERSAAVTGPSDAARTLNLTRHSVADFRNRAAGNQQMLSSTLSPSRPADRTGRAMAPAPGGNLFRAIPPNGARAVLQPADSALGRPTLRRREVSVDVGRLARLPAGGRTALRLNLFDDLVLTGLIERRTPTFSGGHALSGRLAEVPGGTVTLVVNGSVVAGTVRLPGATYRIRPTGSGSHSIVQLDPSQFSWRCGTERRPQ